MNLKTSFPKGLRENDVIFSLPYDIKTGKAPPLRLNNKSDKNIVGHLTVTRENINIYENNELTKTYRIKDFVEIEVGQLIGCSMIRGKYPNGKWQCMATFTQTQFLRYAELAKILDYYLNTGIFTEKTDADEPSCPKCGLSLGEETNCVFCQNKGSVLWKLFKRIAPFKKLFIFSFITSVIVYALDVVSPMIQRLMIDNLIVPKNLDWDFFGVLSLCIISIGLIDMGMFYVMYICNAKMASAFGRNLRADIFNKTQELSMASVNKRTAGELINRISSDAQVLQDFVTREGRDMIFEVLALVSLSIVMFVTNWKLALIVVIPLPLTFWFSVKVWYWMWNRWGQQWRYSCRASDLLHDIIHGIRVIKNYGSEDREVKAYTEASKTWANSVGNAEKLWHLVTPPIRYLVSLGEFAALYVGGSFVLGEQIGLGELVQFTAYVYMLYGPIQWLVRLPRVLAQAGVSATKVFEILEEQTTVSDSREAIKMEIKGNIDFEHVFFGYKVYNPVLKDISCQIKAGEMIGVVGHSGVGKSTFINLMMRLYDTTAGVIKIDGVDIRKIEQESLRSQVGVVLQETFLFNGSVVDNIRYAKPGATFEEIVEASKVANCHDFIVRLPDGYNTIVGERGYNLSGGERQRVAIARAILHNPKVIILDEATASLDTQTEKQIQEALNRLTEGRTTVAIAHRLSTLSHADRLIVLDKGRVAEIGTHNELMGKNGVYYSLVMAQRQTARIKKVNKEQVAVGN